MRLEPPVSTIMAVEGAYTRSTLANAAFGSKGGHKLSDFLIEYEPTPKRRDNSPDAWKRWAMMAGKR
jgi:hypothetical protein